MCVVKLGALKGFPIDPYPIQEGSIIKTLDHYKNLVTKFLKDFSWSQRKPQFGKKGLPFLLSCSECSRVSPIDPPNFRSVKLQNVYTFDHTSSGWYVLCGLHPNHSIENRDWAWNTFDPTGWRLHEYISTSSRCVVLYCTKMVLYSVNRNGWISV